MTESTSWLEYLKAAKAKVVGLALICKCAEGADSAKRQLYSARAKARDAGDKTLDNLSISQSPHSDDILLIYKTKEGADDSPESPGKSDETNNNKNL